MPRVGVLALQGGFAPHLALLARLGSPAEPVRHARQLERLDGLVLPGGESTTLLNLMRDEPWTEALRAFHARGAAMLATCAGLILLAREVRSPAQPSLGLLDAVVERNGYGRQVDSFEAELKLEDEAEPLPAVFIRAPRVLEIGSAVEVLARWRTEPVLVRQACILGATFHPELTADGRVHVRFLELTARAARAETATRG